MAQADMSLCTGPYRARLINRSPVKFLGLATSGADADAGSRHRLIVNMC
jgi:hypothetical protein